MQVFCDGDIDKAIRVFDRKMKKDGSLKKIREMAKGHYDPKPSVLRREKSRRARQRAQRDARRREKHLLFYQGIERRSAND